MAWCWADSRRLILQPPSLPITATVIVILASVGNTSDGASVHLTKNSPLQSQVALIPCLRNARACPPLAQSMRPVYTVIPRPSAFIEWLCFCANTSRSGHIHQTTRKFVAIVFVRIDLKSLASCYESEAVNGWSKSEVFFLQSTTSDTLNRLFWL